LIVQIRVRPRKFTASFWRLISDFTRPPSIWQQLGDAIFASYNPPERFFSPSRINFQ